MFFSTVQPSIVSLFSSTGSDPLALFSTNVDHSLPSDSFISLLNDSTSLPLPPQPATLIVLPPLYAENEENLERDEGIPKEGRSLDQTVLHIQSPTLRTTYILCPADATSFDSPTGVAHKREKELGLKHPWVHLQVRNVAREWSFELGVVDKSGREGIIRCSTFQKEPNLKLVTPPLLHLPLAFPTSSSRPLTAWSTISINLPPLLPHFSSAALTKTHGEDDSDDNQTARRSNAASQVPNGTYSHCSYVKVYATCRLRRIWFSESAPQQNLPWEFQLYSST
ncbi:Cilia- and flagella-associated protein 20/CFAP20DC [Abortiporus biennis]